MEKINCNKCIHCDICKLVSPCSRFIYYNGVESECVRFIDSTKYEKVPCKIGDLFYRFIVHRAIIDKCRVSSLTQKVDKSWKIRLTSNYYKTVFEITIDDTGKHIFYTVKEAQDSLNEYLIANKQLKEKN